MATPLDDSKKKALETASIIEEALRSIADNVAAAFEASMSGMDKTSQSIAKDIQARFNKMAKVTDDIASNAVKLQQGLLSVKGVKDQILQRTIKENALATQLVTHLTQETGERKNIAELIEEANNGSTRLTDIQRELVKEYQNVQGYNKEYIEQLKEQQIEQENINKKLGISGSLIKGISKIPILGDLVKTDEALAAMNKKIAEGGGRWAAMGAGLKSIGGDIAKNLTDPLVVVGFLVKAFKFFLEYALKADQNITDLGKSMGVSNEEATKLYTHFGEIQNTAIKVGNSADGLLKTQQNQFEAQLQIADALGAAKGITDKQIDSQIYVNKQLKLSAEAQKGMIELGSLNNIEAIDMVKLIVKQTGALSKQTGIQLDNKKVIEQVSKVSGQLSANYKNDPTLIAKAVVQANKLGLTLEQAAAASSKLLDFESSIQSELEAELITGKDLNLEKARLLTLNGDAAGAAAEMLSQVGSLSEFQDMNVLQQGALAKAVGMTAGELANSLKQQQNLNNLGDENKKQIEEAAEKLRESGDIIKANALLNQTASDAEAVAALGKLSEQEKFNAAVEKLKATLGAMMSEEMIGLVQRFVSLVDSADEVTALVDKIRTGFALLGAYMAGKLVWNFTLMAGQTIATLMATRATGTAQAANLAKESAITAEKGLQATGAIITAEASSLGAATPFIIAGIATALAAVATYMVLKDGHIGSDGGLIVSGKKGTYQLDENDSVIAGTNLMGDGKINKNGEGVNLPKGSIGKEDNKSTDVNVTVGPTTLTIDGMAFAKTATPYIVAEMKKLNYLV